MDLGTTPEESALDAALEALTRSGWRDVDVDTATAGSEGTIGAAGTVQELVRIAADLRRAIAATPSQQARLRHQAIIARTALGPRGRTNRTLRAL